MIARRVQVSEVQVGDEVILAQSSVFDTDPVGAEHGTVTHVGVEMAHGGRSLAIDGVRHDVSATLDALFLVRRPAP